jgi:predicted ATPase
LTSFIGRQREMTEVKHLLTTQRLLTLTGADGSGKNRLAVQVAIDLVDAF